MALNNQPCPSSLKGSVISAADVPLSRDTIGSVPPDNTPVTGKQKAGN